MQLQSMLFMLMMLVVFPIILLSSDHNLFYVILSFVLVISSIGKIRTVIFTTNHEADEETEELEEEIEDAANINVKRFGIGTKVVKNLIIILFFIYCNFFIHTIGLKIVLALVILYWLHETISTLSQPFHTQLQFNQSIPKLYMDITANTAMILIIILVAVNKTMSGIFK